jgi:hypothetical protein
LTSGYELSGKKATWESRCRGADFIPHYGSDIGIEIEIVIEIDIRQPLGSDFDFDDLRSPSQGVPLEHPPIYRSGII